MATVIKIIKKYNLLILGFVLFIFGQSVFAVNCAYNPSATGSNNRSCNELIVGIDSNGDRLEITQADKDSNLNSICTSSSLVCSRLCASRNTCQILNCYYKYKDMLYKDSSNVYETPCTDSYIPRFFRYFNFSLSFTPSGCQTNADCTDSAKLICDTSDGECKACVIDGDCAGASQVCNASNQCECSSGLIQNSNGDCVDCEAGVNEVNCTSYEYCDLTYNCKDKNECANSADNNCDSNATCADIVDGFNCSCKTGYTGDGVTCTDQNECLGEGSGHNCDPNALCINIPGSFSCLCNPGYSGDGQTCTDIDECTLGTDNCDDTLATCTNNPGSFSCGCITGYDGDGVTCTDIDECLLGTDDCGANASCTNTVGSFTCACDTGFSGDGYTCVDIDECTLGTDNCHSTLGVCTNTIGSFSCGCIAGYTGDGVTCSDIDECALGTDNCHSNATCANTPGSFTCTCNSPSIPVPDGTNCVECTVTPLNVSNCNTAGGELCGLNNTCGLCDALHLCPTGKSCKIATQQCVDCILDSDCTGPNELCGTDNTCAPCNATTHICGNSLACDTGVNPANCVECTSNPDCPGFQTCNTTTNQCEGCINDCPSEGKLCNVNTGFCEYCLDDCGALGKVCDVGINTCVACLVSPDCPNFLTGEFCDVNILDSTLNTCNLIGCPDDTFCQTNYANRPICETTLNPTACVECRVDADCDTIGKTGYECLNFFCWEPEAVFQPVEVP